MKDNGNQNHLVQLQEYQLYTELNRHAGSLLNKNKYKLYYQNLEIAKS